jgi:hypothetical protein
VFGASVSSLPGHARSGAVIARLSWRWVAAAAALLLSCSLALRLGAAVSGDQAEAPLLAVVIESSGGRVLGDDFAPIEAVHGGGLADLDDEIHLVLADGRFDR